MTWPNSVESLNSSNNSNSLSKQDLLEIEKVCDAYEDQLRIDSRQQTSNLLHIDAYVENAPPHLKERLKCELIEIRREWNELGQFSSFGTIVATNDQQQLAGDSTFEEPSGLGLGKSAAEHRRVMQDRLPPRFLLQRYLGEGATAEVWLALDSKMNRDVAIKIAHTGAHSPLGFLREARSNSRLRHENIVRVLEIAPENTWQYLVCEYVDGISLAKRLEYESPSPKRIATWIASLADSLAYAHSLGVVHRDIKPQNILIDQKDQVHITDFGIAKDFADQEATHTRTGRFMGTPAYMSPQQASGTSSASPSDDVYSLGIVFYKMLTGDVPFRGTVQSVAFQVVHCEPQAIRESHPDVPSDLELLCMKCIEKRPSDRLPSAEFLRDELLRYLRQEPLVSRPATRTQLLIKWIHRNPRLARSLATSFALLTLLTCVSVGFAWKLNLSWRNERQLRVAAEKSERKTLEALDREKSALENVQRVMTESDQVISFMETIFQSNDPVYAFLQQPNSRTVPTLQSVLDNASSRIQNELRDQPHLQSRLIDILGNSYRATGHPAQAMELFEKSEELRKSGVGEKTDAGLHEYYLGCWHHEQGDLDSARSHYEQSLNLFSKAGLESPRTRLAISDVEFQLGRLFIDRRDNQTALIWMQRCLEHRRAILAPDTPRLRATEVAIMFCKATDSADWPEQLTSMIGDETTWYNTIAKQFTELMLARQTLPPKLVKPLFERLLNSLEESLSARHAITLLALGDYAGWLHDQGDYEQAYPITTKLIETANSVAPNHPRLVEARIRFGYELLRSQKFEEANRNYNEALEAKIDPFPGFIEALEGKLWCSIVLAEKSGLQDIAARLVEQLEKRSTVESAWIAYSLARCYGTIGDSIHVQKYDAIAIDKAQSCQPIPENSMWLERLATIYSSHSQYDRSTELLQKAVSIERATRPAKHPRLADRLLALGDSVQRLGKVDEAKSFIQEAIDIYQARMPKDDRRIEIAKERLQNLSSDQVNKRQQETIE